MLFFHAIPASSKDSDIMISSIYAALNQYFSMTHSTFNKVSCDWNFNICITCFLFCYVIDLASFWILSWLKRGRLEYPFAGVRSGSTPKAYRRPCGQRLFEIRLSVALPLRFYSCAYYLFFSPVINCMSWLPVICKALASFIDSNIDKESACLVIWSRSKQRFSGFNSWVTPSSVTLQ